MNFNFEYNGKTVTFTDDNCSGVSLTRIYYGDPNSVLFTLVDIELVTEIRQIEKKGLFGKTKIVEQEEYILRLKDKPSRYSEEIKEIDITVSKKEKKNASQIVEYVSGKIKEHELIVAEKKRVEELEQKKLRELEEKRLQHCKYDFVVIDFETTGFNAPDPFSDRKRYDEILSVSIIDNNGNELLNTYCQPKIRKTWKSAEETHGITPAMVKGCPSFEEVLPQVKDILCSSKYVLAYNIDFERSFLEGYDISALEKEYSLIPNLVWGPDPMLMYTAYAGKIKWQKLTTAARHFKYKYNAHDSLEDVKATLFVYNKLLEYLLENPEEVRILNAGFDYEGRIKGTWLEYPSGNLSENHNIKYGGFSTEQIENARAKLEEALN